MSCPMQIVTWYYQLVIVTKNGCLSQDRFLIDIEYRKNELKCRHVKQILL